MSYLTLRKSIFRIGHSFCIVEYVKNVNIRNIIAMTFHRKPMLELPAGDIFNHLNQLISKAPV